MIEPNVGTLLSNMRVSLQRLASPASAQVSYLHDLGVGDLADELALEFDAVFQPLSALLRQTPQFSPWLAVLQRLDSALDDDELTWRSDSLTFSPAWEQIRRLAADALRSMPPTDPVEANGWPAQPHPPNRGGASDVG